VAREFAEEAFVFGGFEDEPGNRETDTE